MFYVYVDSFYGTELIGKAETHEGAEKIKAKKMPNGSPAICGAPASPTTK